MIARHEETRANTFINNFPEKSSGKYVFHLYYMLQQGMFSYHNDGIFSSK